MYLLQCWFSLSDEGVEDAIYDSYAMRKFMGINFFEQDVPDATTYTFSLPAQICTCFARAGGSLCPA